MKSLIVREDYNEADYLIIYGCHIKKILDQRLEHALVIINNKKIDKIVLTGGVGLFGNYNESEYMYNYLIAKGLSKERIIIEDKSTTTKENNINVMTLLELDKINKNIKIVLVSQKFHLYRIRYYWRRILNNKNIKFYYDYV